MAVLDAEKAIENTMVGQSDRQPWGKAQTWVITAACLAWALGAADFTLPVFIARAPPRKIVRCPAQLSTEKVSCIVGKYLPEGEGCDAKPGMPGPTGMIWMFEHPLDYVSAEYELVCDRKILAASVGSAYFFGVLVGNMALGPVPDMIGRAPSFCMFTAICVPGSLISAFAHTLTEYLAGRFLLGVGVAAIVSVGWVAASEIVGSRYKTQVVVILNVAWACGGMALVPIITMVPAWRTITEFITLCHGFLFLVSLFMWKSGAESPQWLAGTGNEEKFHAVMQQIAVINQCDYKPEDCTVAKPDDTEAGADGAEAKAESSGVDASSGKEEENLTFANVLCTCPWSLYTAAFSVAFFSCSLGYFGLSLNAGNMGHVHVNSFMSSLGELPGYLFLRSFADSPSLGRKKTLFLTLAVTAGFCWLSAIFPYGSFGLIVAATLGKTAVCMGYGVIYLFSAEVYPVLVRSFSLGIFTTCSRISGMFAPVVATLPMPTPLLLIGFGCVVSLAPVLCLPETLPSIANSGDKAADAANTNNDNNINNDSSTAASSQTGTGKTGGSRLFGRSYGRFEDDEKDDFNSNAGSINNNSLRSTADTGDSPSQIEGKIDDDRAI